VYSHGYRLSYSLRSISLHIVRRTSRPKLKLSLRRWIKPSNHTRIERKSSIACDRVWNLPGGKHSGSDLVDADGNGSRLICPWRGDVILRTCANPRYVGTSPVIVISSLGMRVKRFSRAVGHDQTFAMFVMSSRRPWTSGCLCTLILLATCVNSPPPPLC
jgi:hypothetical protein